MESECYTVEDLNPRSHAVKDIEMSVRRGLALAKLCRVHLDLCEGKVLKASNSDPRGWGSLTPKGSRHNPATLLREAFDHNTEYLLRFHWKRLFMQWYTGSLDRQIAAAIRCLPSKVADKYRATE